jgi:arylsulfatase A-like enzyme
VSSQPNLLFIYTDEQRYDTLAAYGNERIEMPNLNRLASESTVFDRAYVTQPVCTPSRSTLLTGMYPHANGCTENNVPLRADTPCLPEMLTPGTYATGHYGKWHLGDEIFPQHGFDEWVSIEDGYAKYYSEGRDSSAASSYHQFLIERGLTPEHGSRFGRGEAARLPEEVGKPAFLAREAVGFLERNRSRPFALYVNFLEPHMPFFGPRDDQYDPADIPLPPNFDAVPGERHPLKTRAYQQAYLQNGFGADTPLETETDWRRLIARYWGLCSLVDTHVGTILRSLEELGLADNTIVVFTSDHGDMMGSHRLLAKTVMFEEAVRVPLTIRLPGQRRQRRVAGPVSQVDLVPTLLDLMNAPLPTHLQGASRRTALESGDAAWGEDAFIEWNGPNSGLGVDKLGSTNLSTPACGVGPEADIEAAILDPVRSVVTKEGWKLNWSPRGEHELYDLASDPWERTNRAFDPDQAPRVADGVRRIREWQERTGDTVALPDPPA